MGSTRVDTVEAMSLGKRGSVTVPERLGGGVVEVFGLLARPIVTSVHNLALHTSFAWTIVAYHASANIGSEALARTFGVLQVR